MARNRKSLSMREQQILEIDFENCRREELAEDFNERIARLRDLIAEHAGYVHINVKTWPIVFADLLDFPERN